MSYFLIVLVIFIALSPLITMRPSKYQLKLARLREAGAINGLQVQLRRSPLLQEGAANLAFYSLRRPRGASGVPKRATLRRDEGAWSALDGSWPQELQGDIEILPAGCDFLLADPAVVGVIWDERGNVDDVEAIANTLKALFS